MEPRVWPQERPHLLPFAPMIYVAWADGSLSDDQLRWIRGKLEADASLDEEGRALARLWLDPASPPTPLELQHLLGIVQRQAPRLAPEQAASVAELGMALLPDTEHGECKATGTALAEIEVALGIAGHDVSRDLLRPGRGARPSGEIARPLLPTGLFDWMHGPRHAIRERVLKVLGDDEFRYPIEANKEAHRDIVFTWVKHLAAEGFGATSFPKDHGGADDFRAFLEVFETLAYHDPSLVIKFGVQFGLFGGSVLFLGTEDHHRRYFRDIGSLALPGCFAMTELGHGSNVWDLETEATYDATSQEFVIHSPSETARKEWIGNAAVHGKMATVFAQLLVGGEGYGVHAFLVPIRNEAGDPLPGVRIEDCGQKEGLNGVDNGRLWFDHVRIPRTNLLNRYGDVSADGIYSSPLTSPYRRFFTMLGTLVGGRVSIASAALSASKVGLTIAIRYGSARRQFGVSGAEELPILDYITVQRRLLPRLATTYVLDRAQRHLTDVFLERTENNAREVEALAAGIKAYASWHNLETLQACRECCGGQGFLAANRLGLLRADTDIYATFEGDNTVLMQLVAKSLLSDYKAQFGEMRFWGMVKWVADRASTAVSKLNPVVTRLSDADHLNDPEFQLSAFRYREGRLLVTVARRLKSRIDDGADSFEAFNACQDHLVTLANAHVERIMLEQMIAAVAKSTASDRATLDQVRSLFALWRIEQDRGWFLENGFIEGNKAKAIRGQVNVLCEALRTTALELVDAFGIPDDVLGAPIAFDIDPRVHTSFIA